MSSNNPTDGPPTKKCGKKALVRVSSVALVLGEAAIAHGGAAAAGGRLLAKRTRQEKREAKTLRKRVDTNGIAPVPAWALLDADAEAAAPPRAFCKRVDEHEFALQADRSAAVVAHELGAPLRPPLRAAAGGSSWSIVAPEDSDALADFDTERQAFVDPEADAAAAAAAVADAPVAAAGKKQKTADDAADDPAGDAAAEPLATLLDPSASARDELAALKTRRQSLDVATLAAQRKAAMAHCTPSKKRAKPDYVQSVRLAQQMSGRRGASPAGKPSPKPSPAGGGHGARPMTLRRTLAVGGLQISAIQSGAFGGRKVLDEAAAAAGGAPSPAAAAAPQRPASPRARAAARIKAILSPRKTPKKADGGPRAARPLSPTNNALDLAGLNRPRRLSLLLRGKSAASSPAGGGRGARKPVAVSGRQDTAMKLCEPRYKSARESMKANGVAALHELLEHQRGFVAKIGRQCVVRDSMLHTFTGGAAPTLDARAVGRIFSHCMPVRDVHNHVMAGLEASLAPISQWVAENVEGCDPDVELELNGAQRAQLARIGRDVRVADVFETLADELERVHRIDSMSADLQLPAAETAARANGDVARFLAFNAAARNGAGEFEKSAAFNNETFQEQLMAPTQHLLRLPLMLRELVVRTDAAHPEHAARVAVHARLEAVSQAVNAASRIAQQERAAIDALDSFTGGATELEQWWTASRALVVGSHERLLKGEVAISESRLRLVTAFDALDDKRVFVFNTRGVVCAKSGAAHFKPLAVFDLHVLFLEVDRCAPVVLRSLAANAVDAAANATDDDDDDDGAKVVGGASFDAVYPQIAKAWPSAHHSLTLDFATNVDFATGQLTSSCDSCERVALRFARARDALGAATALRTALISAIKGDAKKLAIHNKSTFRLARAAAGGDLRAVMVAPKPAFVVKKPSAAAAHPAPPGASDETKKALAALMQSADFQKWQDGQEAERAKKERKSRKKRKIFGGHQQRKSARTPLSPVTNSPIKASKSTRR